MGFEVNFEIAKHLLEENDGCGNTSSDGEARPDRYRVVGETR